MELWDLYTEDRRLTGEAHIRGNKIPDGRYHLVVQVWIKNKDGKYSISQRDESRKSFPLMWECVGGSVLKGEASIDGAIREAKEEIGVELDANDGTLVFSKVRKTIKINGCDCKFSDILDVWLFEYNGEIDLKNATTNEVAQTKWMTKDEIKKLYDDKKLIETLSYFFENNAF